MSMSRTEKTGTRGYWTISKSGWGNGPWQDEPDKMQWQDAATGLPCLVVRHPDLGQLCGYVGLPPSHPAHGKDYDALPDFAVHGGLSFAGPCQPGASESTGVCHVPMPGEPDDVWWLGFDCGHAFDLAPGLQATLKTYGADITWKATYRDLSFVADECASLARQLLGMDDKLR